MEADANSFELTEQQCRDVQEIIDSTPPGRYTLRQIFGPAPWNKIGTDGDKREYGSRFYQSYAGGKVHGLTIDGHKSFSRAYTIV